MKKILFLYVGLLLLPQVAVAQTFYSTVNQSLNQPSSANTAAQQTTFTNGTINYVPLEPLTDWDGQPGAYNNFSYYLNTIFKLLLTLGTMFAVVMLVYGGVMYMMSGAASGITVAKKRITSAFYGLALLAGAWLILYTINPQLLQFNLNPSNATVNGYALQNTASQSPIQNTSLTPQEKLDLLDSAPKTKENCQLVQQALQARTGSITQLGYDLAKSIKDIWNGSGPLTDKSIEATYEYAKECGEKGLI